ncbi:hypothetical protein [uncultured Nostoc sp.]|uniref:hypothetical protein n=1 Tax=uncultured Nostoc sp. TaxID=340711 RepID=UPI0035C9D412
MLQELGLHDVTQLGWSLGAPVIWSYLELFRRDGQSPAFGDRVRDIVVVQQSPRQYYTPDWKLGHRSCYDAESLALLQA